MENSAKGYSLILTQVLDQCHTPSHHSQLCYFNEMNPAYLYSQMYFQITEFSTSDRCHLKSCLCHRRAMCQWVRYKLSESESVSSPASKMLIHAVQKCSVLWVLHWHRAWQVADVQINGSGCYYCYCLDPSLIIMSRVEGCCEHKRGGLL